MQQAEPDHRYGTAPRVQSEAAEAQGAPTVGRGSRDRGPTGFMKTYLEDAEALDGLEFLSMAEAREMAHWEILATLNETAKDKDIAAVVKFALPLRRSHVDAVRKQSLRLAAEEDPSEPA